MLAAAVLVGALVGGLAGGAAQALPASATAAGAPLSSVLGVYAGPGNVEGVRQLGRALGHQPTFAMDFLAQTSWGTITHVAPLADPWRDAGYRMIWGVPMLPSSGGSLATGATGAYDHYFRLVGRRLVAAGQGSSVIRLGWEFNGFWFPWSAPGHAAQFVDYFRQIVTTMRSVPGSHFTFDWNPVRGDQGAGTLAAYYPGDRYVDGVGLDIYDTEWAHYPGSRAEFRKIETERFGLDWLARFAARHGKPIVLPEVGLGWGRSATGRAVHRKGAVSGGDDAVFIAEMARWVAHHDVAEITFWDYGTSSVARGRNPRALSSLVTAFGTKSTPKGSAAAGHR